jgi:DNA mismatch repair ATPase MutS
MRDARDFSRLDEFLGEFAPLTPYGRERKERKEFIRDRAELERRYDLIDEAIAFSKRASDDHSRLNRLTYHLKRIPRLPTVRDGDFELVELFQYKKFLANYRAVYSLLDDRARERFGFHFSSSTLAAEFDRGGSDAETFYLADCYDESLASARKAIASLDEGIRDERSRAERALGGDRPLRFDGRPFIVVDAERARALAASGARISLEAHDSTSYAVRMLPTELELILAAERERELERERIAEAGVIARLSEAIRAESAAFAAYASAVEEFDASYALANLAIARRMVRPRLDGDTIGAVGARFVPCQEDCRAMGLAYTPLDFDPGARVSVLFGSNMGGKTIALRTVAFLQLLAQSGSFVPAEGFRTRTFDSVRYVGELRGDRATGLSGFGFEIRSFVEAWEGMAAPSLCVFDEFARTTGSHEAEAILSAAIEATASKGGAHAVFATHFRGVDRIPGVRYSRMRGLDRESLGAAFDGGREFREGSTLEERIAGINRHMAYLIVDDDGSPGASDAIDIAEMLGLETAIVERARARFLARRG